MRTQLQMKKGEREGEDDVKKDEAGINIKPLIK